MLINSGWSVNTEIESNMPLYDSFSRTAAPYVKLIVDISRFFLSYFTLTLKRWERFFIIC